MLANLNRPGIVCTLSMVLLSFLGSPCFAQEISKRPPVSGEAIQIVLEPRVPEGPARPRWSPKGVQLPLAAAAAGLTTELQLGPRGSSPFQLRLEKVDGSPHWNRLRLDSARNGFGEDDALLDCAPTERNGKTWSSFSSAELEVSFVETKDRPPLSKPLQLSFWFVEDPREPEAPLVIRYSIRSWMEGEVEHERSVLRVVLIESVMDGVFDEQDSWALATASDPDSLYDVKAARRIGEHNWGGEQAFRVERVSPSGRALWIRPHDPGRTRAEEEEQRDVLAVDRRAPRSGRTVAFRHDFDRALQEAKAAGQHLLIDFETTWCGPCKTMDRWVYTADEVVDAASRLVSVKVDGDEQRELVQRFGVTAYPTLVLIDPAENVVRKVVGYQSVKATATFLKITGR